MLKTVKEENITALKADLGKAMSLVLADFRGISVKSDTTLRREFRLGGCRYQVVKNTLLGIAGKALDVQGVQALSQLPGKDELRATFLATLLAVPQNFVRLTIAAQQNFAYLLAARQAALGGDAGGDKAAE